MFELIYGQKGQFCVLYLQIVSFSNLKFSEKLLYFLLWTLHAFNFISVKNAMWKCCDLFGKLSGIQT